MTGKGLGHYLTTLGDEEFEGILLGKGRCKGKGKRSTGKGRRGNPRARDGSQMKSHSCGSTEHLKAQCPKGAGKGSEGGPSSSTQYVQVYE